MFCKPARTAVIASASLPVSDTQRLRSCLSRFLPHVDRERLALTGGVAIELHLAGSGRRGRRECLADLDFVASQLDVIAPTVVRDFLVSHYHVAQPGVPKGIVQLVDPITRLRLDIFPDCAGTLPRAKRMIVEGEAVLVLDTQTLLEHKLQTISKSAVDEKHWLDAVALAALCGVPSPPRPAQFVPDTYGTDLTLACDRCERSRSPAFPSAPKRIVFDLLGHI